MAARKSTRKSSKAKSSARRSRNAAGKARSSKSTTIADAAKREGAKGRRLTPAKTLLRNELIIQRRLVDEWEWPQIAEEAGIGVRQCKQVFDDAEKGASGLLDQRPTGIIEEWLRGYRRSVVQFEALAVEADNTSAAVGAIKAANDARDKIIVLLQAIGHVPHDLGKIKVQRDLETIAASMFSAVEAFRRGDIDEEGVATVFYDAAGIDKPPAQLPAGEG